MSIQSKTLVCMSKASSISIQTKIIVFVILFIPHGYLTYICHDFVWFSSYGGLMTIFSVMMLFNFTFPHDLEKDFPPKLQIEKTPNGYIEHSSNGALSWELLDNADTQKIMQKYDEDLEAYKTRFLDKKNRILSSFVFTIVGTFIWAYASFLNIPVGWQQ